MWVFDATPLIYLAKVDRLTLVQQLDTSCVIPERVYEEVVAAGLEKGYPDARRVERQVDADRFEVISVSASPLYSRLQENSNLSDADVAVLACADTHDAVAVMDETYGRDVAAVEGITTRGTAFLILKCTKKGAISRDEAQTTIDAMIDAGWYCSPSDYTKIVQKLEAISE
jgi:predicted nucleic acid-binding protein